MAGSAVGHNKHGRSTPAALKPSRSEQRFAQRSRAKEKLEIHKNDVADGFRAFSVKGNARMSRAEATAHYIHNNKAEVAHLRQKAADRDVAKMIRVHEKGPGLASTYKPNFADSAWNF